MRIPMQFFFKSRVLPDDTNNGQLASAANDDYFTFNNATEESKLDEHGNPRSRNGRLSTNSNANKMLRRGTSQTGGGGHPLVPRLNLPRPDPNDQWREMMAQAQSYEVESSSLQNSQGFSSSNSSQYEEESEEEEEASESEESEESAPASKS